ncbi:phosphatase PAP2 family protein [Beggiatoa alba]|nr:phosphatase PAP2 family protein [Beggiatoa alba]
MVKFLCVLLCVLILASCGTVGTREGSNWGSTARSPSLADLSRASLNALRAPETWVPVMGAVLFSATDWDKGLSTWARRERPLFGSQQAALDASDTLRDWAKYGVVATALLTPGAGDGWQTATDKITGMSIQLGAWLVNDVATTAFKRGFSRRRPLPVNNRSFPSGHTSQAFAAGTLSRRNLEYLDISSFSKRAWDVGFITLGVGTSWARVEAGMHYPSDVLAGAALGHFIAAVVNDVFLGRTRAGYSAASQFRLTTGYHQVRLTWERHF